MSVDKIGDESPILAVEVIYFQLFSIKIWLESPKLFYFYFYDLLIMSLQIGIENGELWLKFIILVELSWILELSTKF